MVALGELRVTSERSSTILIGVFNIGTVFASQSDTRAHDKAAMSPGVALGCAFLVVISVTAVVSARLLFGL